MVKARIKPLREQNRSIVHCGRCGQRLWMIEHHEHSGEAYLMVRQADGHRYDAVTRTWYPTERYRKKYSAANERILRNREQRDDRKHVRVAHGFRGRRPHARMNLTLATAIGKRHAPDNEDLETIMDFFRVPTRIACVQCNAVNNVMID